MRFQKLEWEWLWCLVVMMMSIDVFLWTPSVMSEGTGVITLVSNHVLQARGHCHWYKQLHIRTIHTTNDQTPENLLISTPKEKTLSDIYLNQVLDSTWYWHRYRMNISSFDCSANQLMFQLQSHRIIPSNFRRKPRLTLALSFLGVILDYKYSDLPRSEL